MNDKLTTDVSNRDLHRTVMVLLTHGNQVLLMKHPKYGRWMGIGGHIEPGEFAYEAAIRETLEEVGLDISHHLTPKMDALGRVFLPEIVGGLRYSFDDVEFEDAVYHVELSAAECYSPNYKPEVEETYWFSFELAINFMFLYEDTKELLRRVYSKKQDLKNTNE